MEKLSQLLLNHRILTFYDFKKEHGDEYLWYSGTELILFSLSPSQVFLFQFFILIVISYKVKRSSLSLPNRRLGLVAGHGEEGCTSF